MHSMHVGAYDKAATGATAKAAERIARSLTVVVILLIAVASVTAPLLPGKVIGPFAGPVAGAFFLLACLTTRLLCRLRSVIKRSAIAAEFMMTENRRLCESEERYRTIVTATPELILICRN